MKLRKFLTCTFVCAAAAIIAISAYGQTVSIVPAPKSVTMQQGTLTIKDGDVISYLPADKAGKFDAEYLVSILARTRGLHLRAVPQAEAHSPKISFERADTKDLHPDTEAYSIAVNHNSVEVAAVDDGGLFYGAVSLWQLLTADEKSSGPATLQCMHIEDGPSLKWRGIMLDSSRHMQTIEFIHQLIDWMALTKLNTLHWHLTDDQGWRLEIKRYPKLTSVGGYRTLFSPTGQLGGPANITKEELKYGGYYTQAQVRELVAYAAKRNVTIVPEIEMPGHETAAIAAYPELASTPTPPTAPTSEYGIHPNLFNVDDKTFEFIDNVLTEVMELFPSQYIHVGGDEAFKGQWQSNPAIQAKIKSLGLKNEDALQSYFIQRVDKFITAHGRHTIGWDEILQGGLAPGAAVMSWHGVAGGITAAKQGHDAVLTPTRPLYLNYRQSDGPDEAPGRWALNTLADIYKFNPAPDSLSAEEKSHILGVQGSLWSEYVITPDRIQWMVFPRAAALAEIGWTPAANRNWDDFVKRMVVENHRFKLLGINFDPALYRVRIAANTDYAAGSTMVTLTNQSSFGDLRYTTDGSPVTQKSAKYDQPITLKLGSETLHAAAFDPATGKKLDESDVSKKLDAATLRTRDNHEMQLCATDPVIGMEQDPPRGERPVSLTNYRNPCWIYKAADLDHITTVNAGVMSLPWLFHDRGNTMVPNLAATHSAHGELEVHLDTCTGAIVASLPFDPAVGRIGAVKLSGPIAAQQGKHDLCFKAVRPTANPLWVIDWVGLQ